MVVYRLCIVGMGVMGGAIGIQARKKGAAGRVIGICDSQETMEKAYAKGAVDEATLDLRSAVADADLVILCVPVGSIIPAAQAVMSGCREGTILTDIGSSKAVIVREMENLLHKHKSKVHFVGSHPVTGSEKKGIEAADAVPMDNAPCVITPTTNTDHDSYKKVEEFWKAMGMKTFRLSPDEHDSVLARSSHLPHLISPALVTIQSDKSLDISGPGLRDMARLAASDPELWTGIVEQNAHEIGRAMKDLGTELLKLAQEIEQLAHPGTPGAESGRERVFRFLADARQRHDKRYGQVTDNSEKKGADGEQP